MITERAMLAAVHISIWTAIKHDRKISRRLPSSTEPEPTVEKNLFVLSITLDYA